MRTTTLLVSALLLASCGGMGETTTTTEEVTTAPKLITVTSKSPEAIAAFEAGRSLNENFRFDEASAKFTEALALDPDFALAHAYNGAAQPGTAGLEELRKAATLSAGLPDAERKQIEAMLAEREGDMAKSQALWGEIATLAPDDWHAQLMVGMYAFDKLDFPAAQTALTRATEIAPTQGLPWNLLGYSQAYQGDTTAAVASFEKYVALSPGEPNPHDSLGEVLMWAGRLEEAEAQFTEATRILPSFYIGFEGLGDARTLRGDFEGGRAAFEQAIAAAPRAQDKSEARRHLAWAWVAAGDPAKAEATLTEAEAEAATAGVATAWFSLDRASMAAFAGRWADVVAQSTEATTRAEAAKLEGSEAISIRLSANAWAAMGESMLGKAAEAEARIPAIEADAAKFPGSESVPLMAKASIAIGKKDAAGAVALLSQCKPRDAMCGWMMVHAQTMAGDAAATDAARAKLLALNERGGEYLAIWANSGGPQTVATTAAADE